MAGERSALPGELPPVAFCLLGFRIQGLGPDFESGVGLFVFDGWPFDGCASADCSGAFWRIFSASVSLPWRSRTSIKPLSEPRVRESSSPNTFVRNRQCLAEVHLCFGQLALVA